MNLTCAVLGSGNIGTDLMYKLHRSQNLELAAVVGIDPESDGLARAAALGLEAPAEGIDWILARADDFDVVFDATSAGAHRAAAPRLQDAGIRSIDLTPAKLGPGVVPVVNLEDNLEAPDVNMITCGGQATIPVVAAISRAATTTYAEIVATIASRSAGPGTRQSIDEFTRTTANGLADIGGAGTGKAIIVLNPVEPPMAMRCTVFAEVSPDADVAEIRSSLEEMEQSVQSYVPGYRLRSEPLVDDGLVTVFVEVRGAGDYLPEYSGNLDIMTAAAVAVGEEVARMRTTGTEVAS